MKVHLAFMVLLSLFIVIPSVPADQTYTISLEGGRWAIHTITVKIPQTPEKAREAVVWAMQTWNLAQATFAQNYFPNTPTYILVESNTTAVVQVTFTNQSYGVRCGAVWADGCTWQDNGVGNRVEIAVQAPDGSLKPQFVIEFVAEHEFGHVLGLAHANVSLNGTPDLMNATGKAFGYGGALKNAPSSLDLFALHILASGTGPAPATIALPSNIPYVAWFIRPMPFSGHGTGDLVLVSYSWPTGGLLTGVLLNNGSTPINLEDAQVFVYYALVSLDGACSGVNLAPRQSCAFSMAPFAEYTEAHTYTLTTGNTTVTGQWSLTGQMDTLGGPRYQLRITIGSGSFVFDDLLYGGGSNQPAQGQFVPAGVQNAIAVTLTQTEDQVTSQARPEGTNFLANNTILMTGAVAAVILLLGAILRLHALSVARRRQEGLHD